jgi:VanZ family protein
VLRSTLNFFIRYWIPLLGYAALVLFLSTQPAPKLPRFDISDKFIHVVEYTAMGMLLFRLVSREYQLKGPTLWLTHILILAAFAFGDELLQSFIPSREMSLLDWLADMAGGIIGAIAYSSIRWLWDRKFT